MTIPIYQVDAFGSEVFSGNPAAICPLDNPLPESLMQKIAAENNVAETAFIVPEDEIFNIRWFTPTVEVALCGHATLAAAFVYFNLLGFEKPEIHFNSKSGILTVKKNNDGRLTLDFPVDIPVAVENPPSEIFSGLHITPVKVYKGKFDYLVELESESDIAGLKPDMRVISTIPGRGVVVTAAGDKVDFVSRCFFPQSGIDEDPVTGSAHCMTTAFWSNKTGKSTFSAIQLSARRGWLECELKGDRVLMSGRGVLFLKGEIFVPDAE